MPRRSWHKSTENVQCLPATRLYLADVEQAISKMLIDYPIHSPGEKDGQISFVEEKDYEAERVIELLNISRAFNRMANSGPLWHALSNSYEAFFRHIEGNCIIPCANGGIALEALAALKSLQAGRKLRWCVSAFGFANTGRGFLADAVIVDCDAKGMLDLQEVNKLDQADFDGIIITNPFGLNQDFSNYLEWQKTTGKALLIDNAAGVDPYIPNVPYQSFSLHHTKPFGFGEGGLAIVPQNEKDQFLQLIDYQPLPKCETFFWVNNGKLPETSCAFHLARLESSPSWNSAYREQAERITKLAKELGFEILIDSPVLSMSLPLLSPKVVPLTRLQNDRCVLAKYYKPLSQTKNCMKIFDRMVNIPSHPGMARLSDKQVIEVLESLLVD